MRIAICTGNGKHHALLETQPEREGLHLYRGGIFVIADENVADPDRERIHCAARRYADVAIAGAAKILHCIERAAFQDLDHSSIPAGRNRTVSPGAIMAGLGDVGSNISSVAKP